MRDPEGQPVTQSRVAAQKRRQAATAAKVNALLSAILDRAFRAELV